MDRILEGLNSQMSLTDLERQKINVPVDVWNKSALKHDLCLVGKVLSRKVINLEAFERTLLNWWNVLREVKMQKLGFDKILIQFEHVIGKNRVMGKGSWVFDKNLVVLRTLEADEDPQTVSLDWCDFFVQAVGIPVVMRHKPMAEVLGNTMGKFKEMDNSHEKGFIGTNLRFMVSMDITKPLRRMINITGPTGQEIQVRLAYERLRNFCYFCGTLGHLVKDCGSCLDLADSSGEVPEEKLTYGDWFRTHVNAQRSKVVRGSLHRSFSRPLRSDQASWHPVFVQESANMPPSNGLQCNKW